MSAEIFVAGVGLDLSDFASMGPRSRERGDSNTTYTVNIGNVLQWGRAHVSAEMSARSAARLRAHSFNGAALT